MVLDQLEFNMKVALVCIAKNEDNYIQEWIDYNLKLGFDHIFIYKNNWEYESDNEKITVIDFPGEVMQLKSYNNFIANNSEIYDWAAFFDVDEFLVLKKHSSIKDFLQDYSKYYSVAINWVLFGDNELSKIENDNYKMIERFTKRQLGVNHHVKTITRVKKNINYVSPHHANIGWVSPEGEIGNGPFNYKGKDEIAQINHYFSKTKEEFLKKISRGRSDTRIFRKINEFDEHNFNEVEDFSALNFFKK